MFIANKFQQFSFAQMIAFDRIFVVLKGQYLGRLLILYGKSCIIGFKVLAGFGDSVGAIQARPFRIFAFGENLPSPLCREGDAAHNKTTKKRP